MSSHSSLNHIYRTVWNQALGAMVAVAEIASGRGSGGGAASRGVVASPSRLAALPICIAVAWGAASGVAIANPTGGVVVAGQANMVTTGNNLLVTTQNAAGTNHSAIDWQSFSIPQANTTHFQQPNAASTVINRVVTNTPSQIFGTLSSNGNLVLVNQAGIAVGSSAVVDTAGFTASALRMSDADAQAGRLRFGGPGAGVLVAGSVFARSGDVVLLGATVDTGVNAIVQSPNGSTILAAGQQVELTGRGLEGIRLQVQAPADSVVNLGTLQGDAVGIFAGTLRHSGVIQATNASLQGGKVVLKAAGDAYVEGSAQILATGGAGQTGGAVDVLGQRVAVTDQARIDVSGGHGGGNVRVGGDYQGKNPNVQNAEFVYFGPQAMIQADATQTGNGGRVIVWADNTTRAHGSISAQGGPHGGDGGFVETSGKQFLALSGVQVDTRASQGETGLWLLDPANIDISSGATSGTITGSPNFSTLSTGGTDTLNVVDLVNALISTNVSVTAGIGLTVSSPIASSSNRNLALEATSGNMLLNAPISLGSGSLKLTSGGGVTQNSGAITATGLEVNSVGPVSLTSANVVSNLAVNVSGASNTFNYNSSIPTLNIATVGAISGVTTYSGTVNLTNTGAISFGNSIDTGSGNLSVNTTNSQVSQAASTSVKAGTLSLTVGTGPVTLNEPANDFTGVQVISAGVVNLKSVSAVYLSEINATSFDLTAGGAVQSSYGPTSTTGNFSVLASSGNISIGEGVSVGGDMSLQAASGNIVMSGYSTMTAAGNVSLQAGAANGLLSIGAPVTATYGSVTYVGDDVSLTSMTTAGTSIEIKPKTASNLIELVSAYPDTNGITRLSVAELGFLTTPLLKVGHISNTGGIQITGNVALPASVPTLSLITSGLIGETPTAGSIAVTNLNAHGMAGVSLTEINNVSGTLAGRTSGLWAFDFKNSGSITVGQVDANNGIDSGGNISLTSAGGGISTSGTGIIKTPGTLTANSYAGMNLKTEVSTLNAVVGMIGDVSISNTGAGVLTLGTLTPGSSGRWLVHVADPSKLVKGGKTSAFRAYGISDLTAYIAGTPPAGNGFVYASAPGSVLVNTALQSGASSNTFGVSPTAILGATYTYPVGADSEDSAISPSGSPTFSPNITSSTNAGSYTIGYAGGLSHSVYAVAAGSGLSYVVDPAVVSASVVGLSGTRAYDGTNVVNGNIFSISGLVGSDTLVLSGSGTVVDKNVGLNKPVNLGGLALGDGTGLASNYTLVGGTHVANITKALLSVTGGTRVYDGTNLINASLMSLGGLVGSETLGLTGNGTLADKNVGTNKALTLTNVALSNGTGLASNYSFNGGPATVSITRAQLTGVSGVTAANRVYDGGTVAALTTSGAMITGMVANDSLTLASAKGSFDNKNVGTGKNVSITDLVFSGADAGNYTVSGASISPTTASIAPAQVTAVSGVTAANRVYDGSTVAALTTSGAMITGMVANDSLTLASAKGSFDNKNVGTGKNVSITDLVFSGADAGNYTVSGASISPTTASIAPAQVTAVSGVTAVNRVYDGSTVATLTTSGALITGMVANDSLTLASAKGSFDDKNVGTGKNVSITDLVFSGADAVNYSFNPSTLSPLKANITQRPLSIWTGPASGGAWSDAANWDALPDASNVGAVALPSAGKVVYDAASGSTSLQSISGTGILAVAGGNLTVINGVSLQGYQQTGGSLATPGAVTVSNSFNQSGGTMVAGGAVAITQVSGDLQVGSITAPSIDLKAQGGINQIADLVTAGLLTTQSGGSTVLNSSGNRVSAVQSVATGPGNIEFTNVGVLDVRGMRTTSGSILVSDTGGISTSGPVVARGGRIVGIANSPLTIGPDGLSADGDIVLTATNLTSAGNITLNGPIESKAGGVEISAANNLAQNSSILAALGVKASAGGTLTFGPMASSGYQPVSYKVNNQPVNPPRSSESANVTTDQVAALMQASFDLGSPPELNPIDILLRPDKERDLSRELIVSEGQICRP